MYSPLLPPAGGENVLSIADRLGVDALYVVGENAAGNDIASTSGYQWYGGASWGPYEAPKEHMTARLLGVEWIMERATSDRSPFAAHWADDDPLADLLAVWLGGYGQTEYELLLHNSFAARGAVIEIDKTSPITLPAGGISPVMLTKAEIEYTGLSGFNGFVVLDPSSPRALMTFWNIRATGSVVFPWPVGHTARIKDSARSWVAEALHLGAFPSPIDGLGQRRPPSANIIFTTEEREPPEELLELLKAADVAAFQADAPIPGGWTGDHPFSTRFQRSFDAEVRSDTWSTSIALPEFVPAVRRDRLSGATTVAAHLSFFQETGFSSTLWVTIPNVRRLAPLFIGPYFNSTVRRPDSEGRIVAVPTSAEDCPVAVLPAMRVVAKLFEGSGWECTQSDNGRFTARLADIVGGPDTIAFNEPAMREVLAATVRSPVGKTVRQLQDTAKRERGTWPNPMAFASTTPEEYSEQVVLRLLRHRLLRPCLSVRCPDCSVTMTLRPEDLTSTLTCDMCSAEYPLGFALALSRSGASWHYRLPQDIGQDFLLESMVLIASAAAIGEPGLGNRLRHQFGVKLSDPRQRHQPPGFSCEMDLFAVYDNRGRPEVVLGEVKNHGRLEQQDLDNIEKLQQWFISQGQHCYPLFATLRDTLTDPERDLLRAYCERAPRSLGSLVEPLFSIVLLKPDLSSPPLGPDYPASWRGPGGSMSQLAVASCKRNLGLDTYNWVPPPNGPKWDCRWT